MPDPLYLGVFVQGPLVLVGGWLEVEHDPLDGAGERVGALSS
jgi:hypothetical protein